MSDFAKKYRAVVELSKQIRMAPRAGWVDPSRKTKDSQTILVHRKGAEKVADELARRMYNGYVWMYEVLNLQGYMSQLADGEEDAECCDVCENTYRRSWMDGKCPYCEASHAAESYVSELLKEDTHE